MARREVVAAVRRGRAASWVCRDCSVDAMLVGEESGRVDGDGRLVSLTSLVGRGR